MKPNVMAGIVVSVIVLIGAFVFINSDDSTDTSTSNENGASSEEVMEKDEADHEDSDDVMEKKEVATEFTAATVAEHNTSSDCWTIVDGAVYDITDYVPRHPGGSVILQACGADGTTLFNSRTTSDGDTVGSGTPHSNNAANQLASFKIGSLDTTAQ